MFVCTFGDCRMVVDFVDRQLTGEKALTSEKHWAIIAQMAMTKRSNADYRFQ